MASQNAITDFKNALAGAPTIADSLTEEAVAEMQLLYQNFYNSIFTSLTKARGDMNYATYARQQTLLKQLGTILSGFKADAGEALADDIRKIAEHTSTLVFEHVKALGTDMAAGDFHDLYNTKYVEQTIKDTYAHIASQTYRMSETIKRDLRKDTAKIMRRASVEGLTRKQATKALKEEILSKSPKFQFIDKAGRSWDSEKYFKMVTRTTMMNVHRETYINTLTAEGKDLVMVSRHNAKCPRCGPWEGKVLSLTGATEGYPTLDAALADGFAHPNCRHSLFAYRPDMEEVFGMTDAAVEKEAAEAMAKLST